MRKITFVFLLILTSLSFYYLVISFPSYPERLFVEKVIDGDTFVSGKYVVRLLGIDAPEKGQKCYAEAKNFLAKLIENKTVRVEYDARKKDKYGRLLAYVWINSSFVNKEMILKGFAVFRNYGEKLKYESELSFKPTGCVAEIDTCEECIGIAYFEWDVKGDDCKGGEVIKLKNFCSFPCNLTNWKIKDRDGNVFVFPEVLINTTLYIYFDCDEQKEKSKAIYFCKKFNGCEAVWDNDGDEVKILNEKGETVLTYSYSSS